MEIRNVREVECPFCGAGSFEDCTIQQGELYMIKYGPMMHVARVKQIAGWLVDVQKMDAEKENGHG